MLFKTDLILFIKDEFQEEDSSQGLIHEKQKVVKNHGSCNESSFNNFRSCLGGYASRKNRDINTSASSVAFFVHYLRTTFSHGLLCL